MLFQMQALRLTIGYTDNKILVVNKQYKRYVVMPQYIQIQHDGFHVKVIKIIYILMQECTNFPKMFESPQNSRHHQGNILFHPEDLTNIRYHHT